MNDSERYACPICGFRGLKANYFDLPVGVDCVCCGFEFGIDDSPHVEEPYEKYRQKWINLGMPWGGQSAAPDGWDPLEQLEKIGYTPLLTDNPYAQNLPNLRNERGRNEPWFRHQFVLRKASLHIRGSFASPVLLYREGAFSLEIPLEIHPGGILILNLEVAARNANMSATMLEHRKRKIETDVEAAFGPLGIAIHFF